MLNWKSLMFCVAVGALAPVARAADTEPDLRILAESTYLMGPGNTQYPIDAGWANDVAFMKEVQAFDDLVKQVQQTVCGTGRNKSVLLVGDPNEAYRYIFARLAANPNNTCKDMWHGEINVSKVEAGHKYVGEVDEYWQEHILAPSNGKNVILYLGSLGSLVGIGSHSNDDTGIEREYISNITTSKIRTVAFMDKYEYNEMIRSKHAYVLQSFAETKVIPPMDVTHVDALVKAYMKVLYPNLHLGDREAQYLYRTVGYYQPNRGEPDRTLNTLARMIRNSPGHGETQDFSFDETFESAHPYTAGTATEQVVEHSEMLQIQLSFETFETERRMDTLTVVDGLTGKTLDTFSGSLGAFDTKWYPTNKVVLKFKSDAQNQYAGYSVTQVRGRKTTEYTFKMDDVRKAVLEVAQVPQWMMDRDYSIVRDLRAKLDGDVVGVAEGKADLVRLAKGGYVAGRTDEKPVATVLLAGPTGTGKSYIAKRFAEYMGLKLITFDMTAYKDQETIKTFQETLARHLTNTPFAVYLFEEIDKASIEVLDQLYFMMDEGIFYDAAQRPLFARGAFILMSTNAASDVIIANPNDPDLRKKVDADLQKHFRASFLNRFDAVSIFKPFTTPEYRQLAHTMAAKKVKLLNEYYGWKLSIDEGSIEFLAINGQSPIYGARPMERLVESLVGGGIAEFQIAKHNLEDGDKVAVTKQALPNDFKCRVNDKEEVLYSVNPNSNGGGGPMSVHLLGAESSLGHDLRIMNTEIMKVLRAERDYND